MSKVKTNIEGVLKSIVERIERIEEEKAGLAADIRDIMTEAKGNGLKTKQIKEVIKLRKVDAARREEDEFVRDQYLRALGLITD